jgi:hypothetical protein
MFFKEIKKVPNINYHVSIFENIIKESEIIVNSNLYFANSIKRNYYPLKGTFNKRLKK